MLKWLGFHRGVVGQDAKENVRWLEDHQGRGLVFQISPMNSVAMVQQNKYKTVKYRV